MPSGFHNRLKDTIPTSSLPFAVNLIGWPATSVSAVGGASFTSGSGVPLSRLLISGLGMGLAWNTGWPSRKRAQLTLSSEFGVCVESATLSSGRFSVTVLRSAGRLKPVYAGFFSISSENSTTRWLFASSILPAGRVKLRSNGWPSCVPTTSTLQPSSATGLSVEL